MAHNLEKQLRPCPKCGGKAEYKHKKLHGHFTLGASKPVHKEDRFIRCSKCHARTARYGKIDNAISAWNRGLIS